MASFALSLNSRENFKSDGGDTIMTLDTRNWDSKFEVKRSKVKVMHLHACLQSGLLSRFGCVNNLVETGSNHRLGVSMG